MRFRWRVVPLLLVVLFCSPPVAAATITLVPGAGFDDPTPKAPEGGNTGTTLGQQRTRLFQAAAAVWGSALTSSQTIKIAAEFTALECDATSGTLGSAGADSAFVLGNGADERLFAVALAEALDGSNLNGSDNEINASFNATIDANDTSCLGSSRWYYGLTGPAPAGTFALYPTVLHEIAHGLGFAPVLCRSDGGCGATPQGGFFSGIPDIWSEFLRDNSGGNEYWVDMTNAERVASFTDDPLLVWDGPRVTARLADFGQSGSTELNEERLRMYAPDPFEPGSSIAHFHEVAAPNLLMEPAADADVFAQTDLTDCLFADIGWINSRCANRAPTLNAISNPPAILEDAGNQMVGLSGIADGDAGTQVVSISASSNNPSLIPNPAVAYANPNATGSLSYTPVANQSGSATITVVAQDNGGIEGGGVDRIERSFVVTVTGDNDAPGATNLSAPETYTEDTPRNLVDIVVTDSDSTSISAQLTLSLSAAGSLSTASAGGVTSTYSAGTGVWQASGALAGVNALLAGVSFVPAAHFNGGFSIATQISDGTTTLTGTKVLTGVAVNDPPSGGNLFAGELYTEDAPLNLIDIVVADVDTANLVVTLTLSDPLAGSLNPGSAGGAIATYSSVTGQWTASGPQSGLNALLAALTFTPASNFSTAFFISTQIDDGVAALVQGSKTMNAILVNDAPTLDAIPNPAAIPFNAGAQSVGLSGIAAGPGEATQSLSITASSDNLALIPHPSVAYVSPQTTGSLNFTPVAGRSGSATITVTVKDNGGVLGGGVDTVTRSFVVVVQDDPDIVFRNGFE